MRVIARMNVGGPAMQVVGLARNLPTSEFEQRIFAGSVSDDEMDFRELHDLEVKVERLDSTGRDFAGLREGAVIWALARHMRRFRPDVVHSHTAKAGVIARVAAGFSGTQPKLVHTYHGHLLTGYFSPPKLAVVLNTERLLARRTNRIVTVGDKVRDDLLQRGIGRPSQYRVIPPGIADVVAESSATARPKLGLAEDEFVVLFLGRLTGIKRVDRLLDSVEILRGRIPNLRVLVAGDGDQRASLEQRVKVSRLPVTFLGWRNDLGTLLGASDCLVLTSDNEGTPVSLIQAGLAGVPVVATRVGSVAEVVSDGETGLLVDREPAAIANALMQLQGDPQLRSRLSERAAARTQHDFTYQRLVDDHVAMYRELVSGDRE